METNTTHIIVEEKYEKLVEMEVNSKSRNLNIAKDRKDKYQSEISAFELLREKLRALQFAAKDLFGFRSPFNTLKGVGDNISEYFSVEAAKSAERMSYNIDIKETSKAQKFTTPEIKSGFEIPKGSFTIKVSGVEKEVRFQGGNLLAFMRLLKKEFENELKLTLLQKRNREQILIFEVMKEGLENRFQIIDDSDGVLDSLNIFEMKSPVFLTYDFSMPNIKDLENEYFGNTNIYTIRNEALILHSINRLSLKVKKHAEVKKGMSLNFEIKKKEIDRQEGKEKAIPVAINNTSKNDDEENVSYDPEGLKIASITPVKFEGSFIFSEGIMPYNIENYVIPAKEKEKNVKGGDKSETKDSKEEEKEKKLNNKTFIGLYYEDRNGNLKEEFFPVEGIDESFKSVSIDVSDKIEDGAILRSVVFVNNVKDLEVQYKSVSILNEEEKESVPYNLMQKASDAHVLINGIEIYNNNNQIEDVIRNVRITLKKPTEGPMDFSLEPDSEIIIDRLINFVRTYNEVMVYLNDTTGQAVPEEMLEGIAKMSFGELTDIADRLSIDYHEDTSASELRRRLRFKGIFDGITSISSMHRKIKTLTAVPYETRYGAEISLLAHLGISVGDAGTGWSTVQKGLLNIKEDTLLGRIENYIDGMDELFGNDINDDNRIDTGLAYEMDNTLNYYVRARGIIENEINLRKTRVENEEKTIEREEEKLSELRQKLLQKYAKMNSTIKNLQQQQNRLNNSLK